MTKRKAAKKPDMGRPPIDWDRQDIRIPSRKKEEPDRFVSLWQQLEDACGMAMNLIQCAGILNVSEDSIERIVLERTGKTFAEFKAVRMDRGVKRRLQSTILEEALVKRDPRMLKWASENLLGWSSKVDSRVKTQEIAPDDDFKVSWQDEDG